MDGGQSLSGSKHGGGQQASKGRTSRNRNVRRREIKILKKNDNVSNPVTLETIQKGKGAVARTSDNTAWQWIEGAVLLLLILTTILIGERLHHDALQSQMSAVESESNRQPLPANLSGAESRIQSLQQRVRNARNVEPNLP